MTRRPLAVRRLAAAAVLPLALATLAACGSEPEKDAADSAAPSKSAAAEESGSEQPEQPSEEPAALEPGTEVEPAEFMDVFEGALDKATTTHVGMRFSSPAGDMVMDGDADFTTDPISMAFTMSGRALQGQKIQTRLVDNVMYLQVPGAGGKFFRVDLDDPSNPLGAAFSEQLDPRAMLEPFEAGLRSATYVGEADLEGGTADEYAVTLASDALLDSLGQAGQVPPGVTLPKTIDYQMFFDDEGRYRRMEVDLGDSLGAITMDYTDWGKDVSITAPPKRQVTGLPGTASATA